METKYKKTISVLIPCYNCEKFIEETINSVLNQTYPQKLIKIICLNDGSTDNTQILLKKIQKNTKNIFIYKQKNVGITKTREKLLNILFKNHKTDYFVFLDSDDLYVDNAFEILIKATNNYENEIVIARAYRFEKNNILKKKPYIMTNKISNTPLNWCLTNYPLLWNVLFLTSFVEKNMISFPESKFFEDLYFGTYLLMKCKKFSNIKDRTLYYRRVENSLSSFKTLTKIPKHVNSALITAEETFKNFWLHPEKFELNKIEFYDFINSIIFYLISYIIGEFKIYNSKLFKISKEYKLIQGKFLELMKKYNFKISLPKKSWWKKFGYIFFISWNWKK